jgi:pimeloyl-ACP methyl ester carboxylesterase
MVRRKVYIGKTLARFMIRVIILFALIFSEASAQNSVSVHLREAIEIGGLRQWISIDGTNNRNPVLLFLHGGPGNSVMSYANKFTSELQKRFVVVQWDQRESGKTAELNASDKPLTVALMESDAVEVIQYLRTRFAQEKIFLMGHSWGGFLGLMASLHHPDLLHAYVAICPMVNQLESERISLAWMINKARQDNNTAALKDLATVNIPFGSGDQLYYHRSWLAKMRGNKPPLKSTSEAWSLKWLPMYNEALVVNFNDIAPEIGCPVYFFVGRKDLQTNWEITRDYYERLKAPAKRLFIFDNSGHSLNSSEPGKFQETVLKEILPLAAK